MLGNEKISQSKSGNTKTKTKTNEKLRPDLEYKVYIISLQNKVNKYAGNLATVIPVSYDDTIPREVNTLRNNKTEAANLRQSFKISFLFLQEHSFQDFPRRPLYVFSNRSKFPERLINC